MMRAQLIMLGLGLIALAIGLAILFRSARGSESQRYARRMIGAMGSALGMSLIIFAIGLKGVKS